MRKCHCVEQHRRTYILYLLHQCFNTAKTFCHSSGISFTATFRKEGQSEEMTRQEDVAYWYTSLLKNAWNDKKSFANPSQGLLANSKNERSSTVSVSMGGVAPLHYLENCTLLLAMKQMSFFPPSPLARQVDQPPSRPGCNLLLAVIFFLSQTLLFAFQRKGTPFMLTKRTAIFCFCHKYSKNQSLAPRQESFQHRHQNIAIVCRPLLLSSWSWF